MAPTSNSTAAPGITDVSHRRGDGAISRAWPDFSIPGAIYMAMTVFMGLAAVNVQANLMFGVVGLMIGVFMFTDISSRAVLSKLRVQRVLPEFAVVGQRVALTYECVNKKRFWPSLSVTVRELDALDAFVKPPVAYMLHAAPHMSAVIATEVIPRRRGVHTLDRFQLHTSFPFGLIRRAARGHRAETFVVYPAIGRVDPKLLRLCVSAESSGATLRPRRGGADEFYGVKEYRPGENPRMIYWRRSARTGTLVSKEMTLVAPPRLLMTVDTRLTAATTIERALVEKTIAMAASLASHALEAGLQVGLCLWSGGWVEIAPNRGKRHREEILSTLATAALNTEFGLNRLSEHAETVATAGTTQVLLTPHPPQVTLGQQARGRSVVISPSSKQSNDWFEFSPNIDFGLATGAAQRPDWPTGWHTLWKLPQRAWRRLRGVPARNGA